MTAVVLRGDARSLPLPDASVDLIVTSPPYFSLRSYTDGGAHYAGQIGSEATPAEWLANLVACTAEWVRVLKPEGSLFVNLGDKYSGGGGQWEHDERPDPGRRRAVTGKIATYGRTYGHAPKSLLGLPWRYALACMDQLGLILRAEIVWAKPNGLPESVTDRVRRAHEQVFHFTRLPRYYAAVDEIREPHQPQSIARTHRNRFAPDLSQPAWGSPNTLNPADACNPLGKLPGSVWDIPSQPLVVPAWLGVDHFAAFPMELPRRCILGWSPPGICTACGEGRRPVVRADFDRQGRTTNGPQSIARRFESPGCDVRAVRSTTITGYACACTPYTGHPGTGEPSGPYGRHADAVAAGTYENVGAGWGGKSGLGDRPRVGPWREYHLDGWNAPPTRPAVVLDPFMGTGTSLLVADVLGRHAIGTDLSHDYARIAKWRTTDPAERARAMQVPKPPPVVDGQGSLFDPSEVA